MSPVPESASDEQERPKRADPPHDGAERAPRWAQPLGDWVPELDERGALRLP